MSTPLVLALLQQALIVLGVGGLMFLCLLVHEAGHAVGGLLCGFRIEEIRVGPFGLEQRTGWKWKRSKARWIDGMVIAQFRELPGPSAVWQCVGIVSAGPLANLVVALLLAPFCLSSSIAGAFAGWLAIASVFVGVLNLFPSNTRLGRSDGSKLLRLMFSRKKRKQIIFGYCVHARIGEIFALARRGEFRQAIGKLDELAAGFLELTGTKPEEPAFLRDLRNKLEVALVRSEMPAVQTEAVER